MSPLQKEEASAIQQRVFNALRSSKDLAREPSDFLQKVLKGHRRSPEALRQATGAIYKRIYYSFSRDLHLDESENLQIGELIRLLCLGEEQIASLNYEVGLSLYKKRFREAVADGELTEEEQNGLDKIAYFFRLRRRDINGTIGDQALAFYAFLLGERLKDHVLSEKEMAELALVARRYSLSKKKLNMIAIPQKKEILQAALISIKARGSISEGDRDHIRSLAHYLNADKFLKPCMMDLDLYDRIFAIRKGDLPTIDPGRLLLESGEKLHFMSPSVHECSEAGKVRRQSGTLYIGSFKIRFVGLRKSHEIRYKNILQINFKQLKVPKLSISLARGRGSGDYRLSKTKDPGALALLQEMIMFLIRKSRGLEKRGRKDTRHIPDAIKQEVWYRDGGQCVLCGAKEYLEFDHDIPLSKGGATSIDNLQILCRRCNSAKGDRI